MLSEHLCGNITPAKRSSYTFLKPPMQGVRTLNTRNGKKQTAATHHDSNTSTNSQKKPLKTLSPYPEPMLTSESTKETTCILIPLQYLVIIKIILALKCICI
jgi:hypothetical protein